jgi:hypothetical protein
VSGKKIAAQRQAISQGDQVGAEIHRFSGEWLRGACLVIEPITGESIFAAI